MAASALHALSPAALVTAWGRAIRRFPVTVITAAVLAALAIGIIHDAWPHAWKDRLPGAVLGLMCAFLAAFAFAVLGENRGWRGVVRHGLGGIALPVMMALTWTTFSQSVLMSLVFLLPGVALLTLAAVLAGPRGGSDQEGWRDAVDDAMSGVFGGVVAVVIGGGLSVWLLAIQLLLGLDVPADVYADTWAVAVCLAFPLTALSQAKGGSERTSDEPAKPMPGWLAILVAGPLTLLVIGYLVLVLLYLLRMILAGGPPNGEVGLVTSVYLAVGVAVHLLSYPLRDEGPRLSRLNYRWFPWALLPALGALVWALAVRVGHYGWTEYRYLVAILALWMALFSATHLFRSRLARPMVPPLVLGCLLALASGGPWGARQVAVSSQVNRLAAVVRDQPVALWKEGTPFPDGTARKEILETLDWLKERDALDRAAPLFAASVSAVRDAARQLPAASDKEKRTARDYSLPPGTIMTVDRPARLLRLDVWSTKTRILTAEGEINYDPAAATLTLPAAEGAPFDLNPWLAKLATLPEAGVPPEALRWPSADQGWGDGPILGLWVESVSFQLPKEAEGKPKLTHLKGILLLRP